MIKYMKKIHPLIGSMIGIGMASVCAGVGPEPSLMVDQSAEPSSWQCTGAVYAPLMGLDGTIGIGPVVRDVELPFHDILSNLDAGLTGAFEARRDGWSITGDLIWLKLSGSAALVRDSEVLLKEDEVLGSLSVGYEIYRSEKATLDLLGGGAFTWIDAELELITPSLATPQRSTSGSQSWIDPFMGIRFREMVSERGVIFATATYGGFGVGSDEYWQLLAGYGYRLSESTSVAIAYRMMATDYQNGGFLYDVKMSGPNLGLIYRF